MRQFCLMLGSLSLALLISCPLSSQNKSGFLLEGPKQGNINLRDEQGNWMIVDGIPIDHPPLSENSVTVAIIDSGVLADHPQLKGLIAEQRDFTGEGPSDRIGHGTVVTIIARGFPDQLPLELRGAPPSRFIVAKVAQADGSIDKKDVIAAIQWAAQRSARVVNLSLGFREGTDDYSELCFVIAKNPEILFVAAAGNFGPNVKVYPAACPHSDSSNLISVQTSDDWSGKGDVTAPGKVKLVPLSKGR